MKILVTGGAGYIGSHVVKQLSDQKQHTILIADNLSTGFGKTIGRLMSYDNNVTFINHDLSDWKKTEHILKEGAFDAVIHFAASLIVPESVQQPLKYYLNNTANSANLIEQCVKYGVKKFVFSSTAAVYGDVDRAQIPVAETLPPNPINPYGHSKRFIEQILQDTTLAFPDFKHVILRYFNVAGANVDGILGQSTLNATHLIKVAAETALGKRASMAIFGEDYPTNDGTCIRDYIHVDDLSSAHLFALAYLDENESNIFNVGYGRGFSVKEVIETMKYVSGVDFKVTIFPRREGDPAILISDNQKILSAFEQSSFKQTHPKLFLHDDLAFICQSALEWERKL